MMIQNDPDLRVEFAPIFERVAEESLRHESQHTLPYEEVQLLKQGGFGALRLPVESGGRGATLEQLFGLLIDLGAADSNLPQIWRNHFAFVEDKRLGEENERWRKEILAGKFFGAAWSERGGDSLVDLVTVIEPHGDDGYLLNGQKYYSTGSIFSDWINVLAKVGPKDMFFVMVRTDSPGVCVEEDWTGIGQRQTGSGSAFFSDVTVADWQIYPFSERVRYQEAFYQLVHLATLGGIARAAHRDLVDQVQRRRRSYPQALSPIPREDPQYHEVVGRVGALASSIEASVLWAARQLDAVARAMEVGAEQAHADDLLRRATVATYEAQLTVTDAALEAVTILYDALGSSALDQSTLLDRHWRNARTIASHNPRIYKARIVGDWHLNGTDPIAALFSGAARAESHQGDATAAQEKSAIHG